MLNTNIWYCASLSKAPVKQQRYDAYGVCAVSLNSNLQALGTLNNPVIKNNKHSITLKYPTSNRHILI